MISINLRGSLIALGIVLRTISYPSTHNNVTGTIYFWRVQNPPPITGVHKVDAKTQEAYFATVSKGRL